MDRGPQAPPDDPAVPRSSPRQRPPTLHAEPPFTLLAVEARVRWLLPAAGLALAVLAVLARLDALPWDRPITDWVVDHRTHSLDVLAEKVTWFGGNAVVYPVAAVCALLAWPRCRPLAVCIVVLAAARSGITTGLKELIDRDRPTASIQLVTPGGPSFPSGHPFATAASWGFVPLVLALYTRRRWLWWTSVVVVWSMAIAVAWSRVWVGVHWTSDVVAGLLLALLGVAGSERLIELVHRHAAASRFACGVHPKGRTGRTEQAGGSR
jgi:undecaprenyl-diphosphatase